MRIAFLVTHLLGTGHLARTAQIADAFTAAGHEALVISGGMPAPLAAPKMSILQQVEPIRSDIAFSALLDGSGKIAGDTLLAGRIDAITTGIHTFAPDVLVTELFPFGRRKLAPEFEAAIAAARGAMIFSSIRDILQAPRKAGRKAEAEARLARQYHGILFHGDTALVDLDESWSLPTDLRSLVKETGYIADCKNQNDDGVDGQGDILVAAGGGSVGDALFRISVEAARLMPGFRWRLLVGGADHEARIAALGALPPNTLAERVRPDFRALLTRCRMAVLQCGYNTAMDVAVTGARAVFCPFEGIGETEQLHRARAMADRYRCGLIREGDLTAQSLATAVDTASQTIRPDYSALRLDGASRSVRIVETALKAAP